MSGKCPDILSIQAVIDGEEKNEAVRSHISDCSTCRKACRDLREAVAAGGRLAVEDKLPESFSRSLAARVAAKPFPAVLVAAALFAISLLSAWFLAPDYLQWWLSVGITMQLSLFIDTFLDLFFLGYSLDPLWVILTAAALVALEVLILSKLKAVEG